MIRVIRTCLLLAVMSASSKIFSNATDSAAEDCGDVQHSVDNGMIRLPDFSGESIRDLNCSWTYTAPPGRKLLVKVDGVHLPPLDLRSSLFQLYIDDQLYDIPRNCVKCLREMVGGKIIKVLFVSFLTPFTESMPTSENETISSTGEGIGSFQVRYKSFDPHRCGKPEQIEYGYVISKGRKLGQNIFYHCNQPYDLVGESEIQCTTSTDTPVPDWNNKAPKCVIHDCNDGPILREAGSGSIASPGYPSYIYQFTTPCQWEITAQPNQQIKISMTYLKLPKPQGKSFSDDSSRLSLIDGESNNYIVNLTESIINAVLNFTTLTNKLTVQFVVSEDNKRKEETGFFLDYSVVSSSCPKPSAPENGEVIAHSSDLGSGVAYRCVQGFVLVGELHAECLLNGKWSHPTPTCEPINVNGPLFIASSNDSDTVTAKLAELPIATDSSSAPSKPSRNGKKKAKEISSMKTSVNQSDVKEKQMPQKDHFLETFSLPVETDKPTDTKAAKKADKENGPKSEPHLLQVIPPKDVGKKAIDDQVAMDPGRGSRPGNATKNQELLPALETGFGNGKESKRQPMMSVTMIAIIAGVGAPLAVGIVLLVVVTIYRRRYPVRMRFGRKFSTFENPMYVSTDAQHPRELKRLTK